LGLTVAPNPPSIPFRDNFLIIQPNQQALALAFKDSFSYRPVGELSEAKEGDSPMDCMSASEGMSEAN